MLKKGDDDSEGKLAKAQKTVDTAHASLEKTRKEMGTAYLKYLESLSDVNARATCPRCSGNGFVHAATLKHDKTHSHDRCKQCSHCTLCDGSGVITNLMGCIACRGNGFVHPFRTNVERHKEGFRFRCALCSRCPECDGKGALSTNHFSTHILSASKALPSLPTPPKYTQGIPSFLPAIPASNPDFFLAPGLVHPHLQGMMTQLERLVGKEEFEKRMELVGKQVAIHAPAVVQASSVGGARTPPNTPRSGSPLRGDSKESNVKYGLHDRQHSSISVHSDATGRLSLAFDWEKPRKPSGSSSSLSPLSLTHTPETPESNDNKFMLVVQHDSKLDVQSMSQKGACPKCKGHGWRHQGSAKHDRRKTDKCRFCVDCDGCDGMGIATDKAECPQCLTQGFVHLTTVREHNVGEGLRCFYCRPCPTCKGLGLISTKGMVASVDKPGLDVDGKKKVELREEATQALSPPLSPRRLPFGIQLKMK